MIIYHAALTVLRASSTDERHYAAMCMQSMYRRRMEEREKQAMASVFQPRAQLMYTGHRNSRTMVCVCVCVCVCARVFACV